MHYDDYFDSFSITSTSKAPEYPLWIPRCFFHAILNSSLFHCLVSSHMSLTLQFQITTLSYTCKMSYEKPLPDVSISITTMLLVNRPIASSGLSCFLCCCVSFDDSIIYWYHYKIKME